MIEKYHPKSDTYQPMTEKENKELEEFKESMEKQFAETHTRPSPYEYEELHNQREREQKLKNIDKSIEFSANFLKKKVAKCVLVFWRECYDPAESLNFDRDMQKFLDQKKSAHMLSIASKQD
ncbi:hypothetical protein B9Z55_003143 [Caenorhabditis nigoni]|uniref:Uncharacterized protein n=1 Tax=Caenorhabditis nigoni TaxID=1611254 RepID=A0A2G5VNV2_9PELO|nr:hypothetical protein B9Z55_003143 [Caenorhabditis nigoni]